MPPETPETSFPEVTELSLLKDRARAMGVPVPNNISVETLKARIEAKMNGDTADSTTGSGGGENPNTDADDADPSNPDKTPAETNLGDQMILKDGRPTVVPVRQRTLRQMLHEDQMRLIRCRITCLDPKKKDLPGEIFTFANEHLGTVRKFIPFGEQTDDGYHIPFCLYRMLKRRTFLHIKTGKDRKGRDQVSTRYVSEFAIEVLPPLTQGELAQLATTQAAAGSMIDE